MICDDCIYKDYVLTTNSAGGTAGAEIACRRWHNIMRPEAELPPSLEGGTCSEYKDPKTTNERVIASAAAMRDWLTELQAR